MSVVGGGMAASTGVLWDDAMGRGWRCGWK